MQRINLRVGSNNVEIIKHDNDALSVRGLGDDGTHESNAYPAASDGSHKDKAKSDLSRMIQNSIAVEEKKGYDFIDGNGSTAP